MLAKDIHKQISSRERLVILISKWGNDGYKWRKIKLINKTDRSTTLIKNLLRTSRKKRENSYEKKDLKLRAFGYPKSFEKMPRSSSRNSQRGQDRKNNNRRERSKTFSGIPSAEIIEVVSSKFLFNDKKEIPCSLQ